MTRTEEMQLGLCKSDAGMVCHNNVASQTIKISLTLSLNLQRWDRHFRTQLQHNQQLASRYFSCVKQEILSIYCLHKLYIWAHETKIKPPWLGSGAS